MEVLLERKWFKPTYTIGQWYIDGEELWDSLEDKDRGLTQDMPTTEIYKKKVFGQTAIPKGRYRIRMDIVSPKFKNRSWAIPYGGKIPRIMDVPAFDGICIHPLNSPADTNGCPGVGKNKVKGKILDSVKSWKEMMDDYLVPAAQRGEEIWLTIE